MRADDRPSDGTRSTFDERLADLDRASTRSLTAQIVELFLGAIASGELPPGAKLPPTRRLAELAAINQLTASRAYRRLQTLGAVVSEVGRGTFVRAAAATPRADWVSIEDLVAAAAEGDGSPGDRIDVRLTVDPDVPEVRADAAQLEILRHRVDQLDLRLAALERRQPDERQEHYSGAPDPAGS